MAGWKHWAVGDALIASDLNGFLSSQVVPRFTTVANRNSAIASPTPGQTAWCADTTELYVYNGAWVGAVPRVKFKTADTNVTSSTTLANDPHLSISLEASSWYLFEFCFFMGGNSSGDIKLNNTYSGTATGSGVWGGLWLDTTNTTTASTNMHLDAGLMLATVLPVGTITGNASFMMMTAKLQTTTAGTFQLQWAQNASNATSSTIFAGSFMSVLKVK